MSDNDFDSPNTQEKRQGTNPLKDITISTIVILGAIVGSAYVGNYRLGQIETHFQEHVTGGHLPQAIEIVKLQSQLENIKIDVERLRRRMRVLENDAPLGSIPRDYGIE